MFGGWCDCPLGGVDGIAVVVVVAGGCVNAVVVIVHYDGVADVVALNDCHWAGVSG